MAIERELLDRLLAGRDPSEVFGKPRSTSNSLVFASATARPETLHLAYESSGILADGTTRRVMSHR